MNEKLIIEKTQQFVKKKLYGESTGHDYWHSYRVWKNSIKIGKREKVDLFVVQLAALLHDISDWKFNNGDEKIGVVLAREWLQKNKIEKEIVNHVCDIIENISFKGIGVKTRMKTKEGRVVQDADRLDAIGAIGIARTFAYGGYKNRMIYDPNKKPEFHKTFEEYKKSDGTTINHFYEKLLFLKDLMNTETAKKMAEKRHRFMKKFLNQFYKEWFLKE